MSRLKGLLRWWWVLAILIVLAGAGAAVWWLRKDKGQSNDLTQIYVVERGNLVATVTCTGEVYAPRSASLSFDVSRIPLIELRVVPGQKVKAGEVLARIDPSSLERAVTQAEADLTVAQDNLEKVKNPYTELDLTKAKLAVSQAEVALAEAQKNLDALLNPDLKAAQQALQDAAAALKTAQNNLTAVQNNPDNAARLRTLEYEATWYRNNYAEAQVKFQKGEITQEKLNFEYSNMLAAEERLKAAKAQAENSLASAQSQLAKAQQAYKDAQENLAKLKAPDELDVKKAQNQLAQAEYNLAKAKADLATIEAGPNPKDIAVAEARVASAKATLEAAKAALEAATMVAPFDGTIISVGASVGDLVSAGTVIVTIADLSDLRVKGLIDETDIAHVAIGQDVIITFDALPGSRFQGKVLEVPLQGKLAQNLLTYEVPISLDKAAADALKPGMTANLTIVVGRRQNVLLIPALAVKQGETGNVVLVQDSPLEAPVETPVELGLSDKTYVEVKRGLNEGDRVVVQYQAPTQQTQQRSPGGGIITVPGAGGGAERIFRP